MKSRKRAFVPAVDGRLEDRVVLNGAGGGIVVNMPGGGRSFVPREAILTTRTYNNVLINIHRSAVAFGNSRGADADYVRLERQVGAQVGRLPYSRRDGLVDYVADSVQYYGRNEVRAMYRDIRSTLISYMGDKVYSGEAAIRKSPGHLFSDADIVGRHAPMYNPGGLG